MFDVFQNYAYCIVQNVIYFGKGKTSLDVKRRKESIRQLIHEHLGWGNRCVSISQYGGMLPQGWCQFFFTITIRKMYIIYICV